MPLRTFKQLGSGQGSEPVTIIAKVNNEIVYSGPVETGPEDFKSIVKSNIAASATKKIVIKEFEEKIYPELFSWTVDTDDINFKDTALIEIEVTSTEGVLTVGTTVVNFSLSEWPIGSKKYVSTLDKVYVPHWITIGDTADTIGDPFKDVFINGEPVIKDRLFDSKNPSLGQWYYTLNPGDTFVGTLLLSKGSDYPAGYVAPKE